ncbi:MAG: NAD-dependent epimerase/dehydratase family protein [Actinobacteria bacterium]|nr:NAD-dependent epimerase/dehydratase family protein [Actinomycetota bacterium]
MSRILVTGGAGFIASHIVDAYLAAGHDVAVVDNLSNGKRENVQEAARFYEVDIRSPQLVEVFAEEKPEIVNHHAAQIDVRVSVEDPLFDADVNVLGMIKLLELCAKTGVKRFVFASSGGAIYGEPAVLPAPEESRIIPLAPYGAAKAAGELYIETFGRLHALSYAILRYGNVYGPRQDPLGEAGVVAIFSSAMLANNDVRIYGAGEQLRDYVYVGDVVSANVAALTRGDGISVNIGTGKGTSVNELFKEMAALTGYEREPIYCPRRAGELERTYLAVKKAKELLGWEPANDLKTGVQKTVEYFRKAKGTLFTK